MHPRRKLVLFVGLAFVGVTAICGWILRSGNKTVAKVSLSFVGYTNDSWVRLCYRIPSASDHSTALFRLENKSEDELVYFHSRLQLRTAGSWTNDANWEAPAVSRSKMMGPDESAVMMFPVPSGACNWRCSVLLIKVHPPRRPNWQRTCLQLIRKAGFNLGRESWEIWSREIVRENTTSETP